MTTARHESRSPTRSRSKALISRIAAPFSALPRHLTDLSIETADPHRIYAPGESVRGSVNFIAHKSIRLTHLVVQLHGFVKVYKNATAPGDGIPAEASAVGSFQGLKGVRSRGLGYAKIFEEEQVLCGAGTLGPGRYQVPFNVAFPASSLPSSLDFERGTISYVLSTVITRPTTVAPVLAQERKIYLQETLDVASMNSPRQRAVSLKPVSKRAKGRASAKQEDRDKQSDTARQSVTSTSGEGDESRERRSPSVSEQSAASVLSSTNGFRYVPNVAGSEHESLASNDDVKIITASVDILREGYLPGDLVAIKVSVKHTKPIKAMQGVIVTLYRRGRIDPFADAEAGGDQRSLGSESLNRSKSAFGAFLPANVTSHNFRYDLDQSIQPMVVNPNTMQGEVKISVRIPEDVFPSITCVPQSLIAFTYHVEVVMDLSGKLSATDRLFPRLSMTRTGSNYELGESRNIGPYNSAEPRRIFDTVAVRRLDSIAHCTFDIVVGTKDSKRKVLKKAVDPWLEAQRTYGQDPATAADEQPTAEWPPQGPSTLPEASHVQSRMELPEQASAFRVPENIRLPELESAADEKTRLRRQEERLLPSQPRSDEIASSSRAPIPSAPPQLDVELDEDAELVPRAYRFSQSTIRPPPPEPETAENEKERLRREEATLLPSAPFAERDGSSSSAEPSSSAATAPTATSLGLEEPWFDDEIPGYTQATSSSSPRLPYRPYNGELRGPDAPADYATDDKGELERHRLLASTSQPDYEESEPEAGRSGDQMIPSAPALSHEGSSQPHPDGTGRYPQGAWDGLDGTDHLPEYRGRGE